MTPLSPLRLLALPPLPLPSVSALHTFWMTLLRSELGVDDAQMEQLKRHRDSLASLTSALHSIQARAEQLQPLVTGHQQRLLTLRHRLRAIFTDEQFARFLRWLERNDWVDLMLNSNIHALTANAQAHAANAQQQAQFNAQTTPIAGGSAGHEAGMKRSASGKRLSSGLQLQQQTQSDEDEGGRR